MSCVWNLLASNLETWTKLHACHSAMKIVLRILDKTVHAIGFSGFRDFLVQDDKEGLSSTDDKSQQSTSKNAKSSVQSNAMDMSLNEASKPNILEGDTIPVASSPPETRSTTADCEDYIDNKEETANLTANEESEIAPKKAKVDDEKENNKPSTSHTIPHDCSSPVRNSKPLAILDNITTSPFKVPHNLRKIGRSTPRKKHETAKYDDSESEDDCTLPEVDTVNAPVEPELPKIQSISAKKDGKEILDAVFLNLKGKDGREERVPKVSAKKNGLL